MYTNHFKYMNRHSGNLRRFVLLTVMVLLAVSLGACQPKQNDTISVNALKEKIDNKTEAYLTDLNDSRPGLTSNEKIAKYIVNWAESKGIRVKTDDGVIVMNVDGSEAYKDARKTVLVCPFDEKDINGTMNVLILAFYVLKNNEDTGRMTALFVPEVAHDMSGAPLLKKKYLGNKTNVICLSGGDNAIVANVTGGASRYIFSKNYTVQPPKNKLAYRITIRGISACEVNNKVNTKLNPIIELNTLMTSLRNSSIDFEIGSMRGGTNGLLYPGSCTLTITVDEDRQAAVEKKILNRIESFDKKKKASDPDAVMEYEETRLPGKVIRQKDSSELAGFIYTLLEDEYHQDEDTEGQKAVCDISFIRTSGGKIRIGSNACSADGLKLQEIDEAEKTLCGLSGFRYKKIAEYPAWNTEAEEDTSEFVAAFKKAYKKYTGKGLKVSSQVTPSYTSRVAELNDKSEILSVTVSDNTLTDLTGTVMEYLLKSNIPPEK